MLKLTRHVPFPVLSMFGRGASVVVYFEDFVFGGLYPIVIAVMTLPPSMSAVRSLPESVILPKEQYFLYDMALIIELKRGRATHLSLYRYLYELAEKPPW